MSVLVPAYGVAPYIAGTLGSIAAQTFQDFEIVLVNDGSPDTPELRRAIEPFAGTRLIYLEQRNAGPSAARNTGLAVAQGEYIAFLDGDDLWDPDYLTVQLREIETRGLHMVYCDSRFFGDNLPPEASFMEKEPSSGPVTLESLILERCVVITSCVLVERRRVLQAGGFDSSLRWSEDFDLWLRLCRQGAQIGYHRGILAQRRMHRGALTNDSTAMMDSLIRIFDGLGADPELPPSVVAAARLRREHYLFAKLWARGKTLLGQNQSAEARLAFQEALRLRPSWRTRALLAMLALPDPVPVRLYGVWQNVLARRLRKGSAHA